MLGSFALQNPDKLVELIIRQSYRKLFDFVVAVLQFAER
jgi:hypothetical protein